MFFNNSSKRVITKEILKNFNEISLAALIISSGYTLDYGVKGIHYNHVFSSRFISEVNWWKSGLALHLPFHFTKEEIFIIIDRLKELNISSVIALSAVRRMRAGHRILIPFEEFDKLEKIVQEYIIEEKMYLIKNSIK